jgi:hypothetical protein
MLGEMAGHADQAARQIERQPMPVGQIDAGILEQRGVRFLRPAPDLADSVINFPASP